MNSKVVQMNHKRRMVRVRMLRKWHFNWADERFEINVYIRFGILGLEILHPRFCLLFFLAEYCKLFFSSQLPLSAPWRGGKVMLHNSIVSNYFIV